MLLLSVVGAVMLVARESQPRPTVAQTLPSAADLLGLVPAGAISVSLDEFLLDGSPYVTLSYTGGAVPANGSFTVYAWDSRTWQPAFDLSRTAAGICQSELQNSTVPVTCAWSVTDLRKLIKPSFDQSSMPDLIAVTLGFSFPPGNAYFSALVLIGNSSYGMAALQTLKFSARGGVGSVFRLSDDVEVEAEAYGQDDPRCCPRSFEYVVLSWVADGFVESAQCVRDRRAFSSAPCG